MILTSVLLRRQFSVRISDFRPVGFVEWTVGSLARPVAGAPGPGRLFPVGAPSVLCGVSGGPSIGYRSRGS